MRIFKLNSQIKNALRDLGIEVHSLDKDFILIEENAELWLGEATLHHFHPKGDPNNVWSLSWSDVIEVL